MQKQFSFQRGAWQKATGLDFLSPCFSHKDKSFMSTCFIRIISVCASGGLKVREDEGHCGPCTGRINLGGQGKKNNMIRQRHVAPQQGTDPPAAPTDQLWLH